MSLTVIILIIMATVFSFLAMIGASVVMYVAASGMWIGVLYFLVSNPPTLMPAGSTALEIAIISITGAAIALLVVGMMKFIGIRRERKAETQYYMRGEISGNPPRSYHAYIKAKELQESDNHESTEDYRQRLRYKLHPNSKR